MSGSISALSNMEYMLYGNTPSFGSMAVPCMLNNYCMTSPMLNTYNAYNAYNGVYNNAYGADYNNMYNNAYNQYGYPNSIYANQQQYQMPQYQQPQTSAQATQQDIDKIADFYNKNSKNTGTLVGAAVSGASLGLMNNMRLVAHPIQSLGALKGTEAMFSAVKTQGTALNQLWNNAGTNEVVRNAYAAMHKAEARSFWKLGLFHKRYSPDEFNQVKGIMEQAFKDIEGKSAEEAKKILSEATAKVEQAYVNNGLFHRGTAKVKEMFTGEAKDFSIDKALEDKEAIKKRTDALMATKDMSFKEALKSTGGIKNGLIMMGFQFLSDFGDLRAAFSKDTKTGMKQVGQTLVNGAGSAAGWAVGQAAGVYATTKLCTTLGTAISPGLGTVIGAVVGLIGGSIGMWLANKGTKAIVGQNVGEKVRMEEMKKTPEGQVQLLQLTAQQKNIPLDVQQSMERVASQYMTAA